MCLVVRTPYNKYSSALGHRSWMAGTKKLMHNRNLQEFWDDHKKYIEKSKEAWKKEVYVNVETHYESERDERMRTMTSMQVYNQVKNWATTSKDKAEFTGEIGKLGALVCERYLDDVTERVGCKLKLMCRANCLPVLSCIAIEEEIQENMAACMMCDGNELEDIEHMILRCDAYKQHRERLFRVVRDNYLEREGMTIDNMNTNELMYVILGKVMSSKIAENNIDHAVKRFLKKAWRVRAKLTKLINDEFNRSDNINEE